MTIVVRTVFHENKKILSTSSFQMNFCLKYKLKVKMNQVIDIKYCVCYYFDNMINGTKLNFSYILSNEKLYENIFVYNISYKTPTGPKP